MADSPNLDAVLLDLSLHIRDWLGRQGYVVVPESTLRQLHEQLERTKDVVQQRSLDVGRMTQEVVRRAKRLEMDTARALSGDGVTLTGVISDMSSEFSGEEHVAIKLDMAEPQGPVSLGDRVVATVVPRLDVDDLLPKHDIGATTDEQLHAEAMTDDNDPAADVQQLIDRCTGPLFTTKAQRERDTVRPSDQPF